MIKEIRLDMTEEMKRSLLGKRGKVTKDDEKVVAQNLNESGIYVGTFTEQPKETPIAMIGDIFWAAHPESYIKLCNTFFGGSVRVQR